MALGRDASLPCVVENLGTYKVSQLICQTSLNTVVSGSKPNKCTFSGTVYVVYDQFLFMQSQFKASEIHLINAAFFKKKTGHQFPKLL